MVVLHAAWLAGTGHLALWAEDSDRAGATQARRRRATRRPQPHPFALDPDRLRLAVAEIAGMAAADLLEEEPVDLTLELPGAGGIPIGSPLDDEPVAAPLGGPPAPSPSEPVEHHSLWTAPGYVREPSVAARLLTALPSGRNGDQSLNGEGVAGPAAIVLAADFRFAARAVEIVVELLARGRLLPDLEFVGDHWRACWRPLIDGHDRGRIEALVWALPASFMAVRAVGSNANNRIGEEGTATSAEVLRSLVWGVADALARDLVTSGAATVARRGGSPVENVVQAWVRALGSPDGALRDHDDDECTQLAGRLGAWHATRSADADTVRTCFRIVPPAADDEERSLDPTGAPTRPSKSTSQESRLPAAEESWRIEFALQAVDDPSLLIPAADVWSDGPELTAMERHVTHPDEALLRGLGQAARLVPAIGRALASAAPCEHTTDAAGILTFLRDGAPLLEEAGFGVLAPPWWRSRTRLGLRLKARSRSKAGSGGSLVTIGLDGLCDIRWEAVLGDDTLGLAELRQLARLKQPLVRVRGQWVELHHDELSAAITAVGKRGAAVDVMSAGEVLRSALGFGDGAGELAVVDVAADGWLGTLLSGAEDRTLEPTPTPDGFAGHLRPYQERGLGWLSFLGELGLGACLADDMGLGKTAQLLAVLVDERARARLAAVEPVPPPPGATGTPRRTRRPRLGPSLVLCPMSLVGNWQRETARFAPKLTTYVHHGPARLAGEAFTRQVGKVDLVLSTYGLAVRDAELLAGVRWRRVVLDEAQQIKNSAARTTQSVRSIPAERRIAMTGTPVENRLSELWSIMEFLNPGILGSERSFRERFADPIERGGDDEVAARLRRITGPFILRRLKSDRTIIADLPEKLEMKEFCVLTREQASLYQAVVDDMLARIDEAEGIERRGLVLATMMKLKQVCNHPAHFLADGSSLAGRSGKLTRLVEVLGEAMAEGDRSLVFTQFTEMGGMLERHLRRRLQCEVLWLHGGVTKRARDAMVERFQSGDGPPVFLLSLKAGGTGLNLTAATQVVHFDRWWNPAVEDQATDRAYRIGQKHNVQVRKFVCGGTLEERIDAMIEAKRALAERIVGAGESWLTEMSTDQLREVIALSADAVGDD
ncbi:MAG TPA: DEAD/DEAH box helicase [Acidimicrobiales bacterium]|jgi:non-specific serine/threonine protein kinase|nr:DEAD/DEAH box helicase [Acidimicrobiales bacterium]